MCLRMRGTGFLLFLLRQLGEEVAARSEEAGRGLLFA